MSSNLHNLTEGTNMLGSSANFNSSGNVKMKFEKTTNLVNLARPPQTNMKNFKSSPQKISIHKATFNKRTEQINAQNKQF